MIQFLILFIPTIAIGIWAYKTGRGITTKELVLMALLDLVVCVGAYFGAIHFSLKSTEYWNGRITDKTSGSQSCCHCTSVCDKTDEKGSCVSSHEECDHFSDYWWQLDLSTGDALGDDCNGSSFDAPAWWMSAEVGMPAVYPHTYTDYLKADEDSLKTPHATKYLNDIPPFPEPPKNCPYCQTRVLTYPSNVIYPLSWQTQLEDLNADLGAKHQVDVYLFVTNVQDLDFADAVKAKWVYGPKNAMTVVFGIDESNTVTWVRVVSLSTISDLRTKLRNDLIGKSIVDVDFIPTIYKHVDREFDRTPMATYEYMKWSAMIPTWLMFLLLLGLGVGNFFLAAYLEGKDIFNEEWNRPRYRRTKW